MSFITGRHLPRRTFLRGMGATVALPLLDAMTPAGRLGRTVTAAAADVTRLVCIEEVHGLPGCNEWGASRHLFAPCDALPSRKYLRCQPRSLRDDRSRGESRRRSSALSPNCKRKTSMRPAWASSWSAMTRLRRCTCA